MIERRDLERRAAQLGIGVRHVELDYVLHHFLAGFGRDPHGLVFRGGTALARIYWPDFRISEDLDFITPQDGGGFPERAAVIVAHVAEETGLDAQLTTPGWRDDRLRATVSWTTGYAGEGELLIDVVRRQGAALPHQTRPLDLRYPDIQTSGDAAIPVLELEEILANKWMMLDDREEPRDLFDLYWGLTHGVAFDAIALAHRAIHRYLPMPASIERAARLEGRWEQRLRHQMHDLVPLGTALEEVRRHFLEWRSSPSGQNLAPERATVEREF